jgi:hypothetical protein
VRLLPNTGCILIKLGDWIDNFPGFEVRDRLATINGIRIAQTISEDWNFGYWAERNGLKVAGTRAVVTEHWGRAPYPSNQSWGAPVDEDWLKMRELSGDIGSMPTGNNRESALSGSSPSSNEDTRVLL